MKIAKKSPQLMQCLYCIAGIIITGFFFFHNFPESANDAQHSIFFGIDLILLSTFLTIFLLFIITTIFGFTNFKAGFLNFLIGDTGTYSLSRLQAVIWAIVIISYQIQLIISLCSNLNGNYFKLYEPIFSESSMWLLGLSMTSYVAVKTITNNSLATDPLAFQRQKTVPEWKDMLIGANGLDFSKCQMLIWTLLAVFVFESKCFFFNQVIIAEQPVQILNTYKRMFDEYSDKNRPDDPSPYVPYLPWSFVVLMGLSQGVYVGKKLVPTFKLDDLKSDKQRQLTENVAQLQIKKDLLTKMSAQPVNKSSKVDQIAIQTINDSIASTQEAITDLSKDINQINTYLNPS